MVNMRCAWGLTQWKMALICRRVVSNSNFYGTGKNPIPHSLDYCLYSRKDGKHEACNLMIIMKTEQNCFRPYLLV